MIELYLQNEYSFAALQLILAMFGMGATLRVRDFSDVAREPKSVLLGCAIQMVLVPLVTYLFIQLLGVSGGLLVGLALIAAIPGGSVSNIFTFLARGNVPLSISITSITTVACLLTTPLLLGLMISQHMPDDFQMPAARIAQEIALCLLLPLVLGMGVLRLWPTLAATLSKWCIRGSLLVIVLIVIGSAGAGRLDVGAFGLMNLAMVCGFFVLLAVVGALAPRLARLKRADSTAIEMEVIVRNVNLGVLINVSLFPTVAGQVNVMGNMVLFSLLIYGALQMLVGGGLVAWRRRACAPASTLQQPVS